jgi:hypothetical protein
MAMDVVVPTDSVVEETRLVDVDKVDDMFPVLLLLLRLVRIHHLLEPALLVLGNLKRLQGGRRAKARRTTATP